MLRGICAPVLLLLATICPASDESASLALLVDTIANSNNSNVQASLLKGMLGGLQGRRNVSPPKGWESLSKELAANADSKVRDLAQELAQIFGDEKAIQQALATLDDRAAALESRKAALQSLLTQRNDEVASLLGELIEEPELAIDAIRGYAAIETPFAPAVLLGRFDEFSEELKRASIETLATRKRYASALLAALKEGKISKEDIPPHVARSLIGILGKDFTAVYGEIKELAQDREQLMDKYRKMLSGDALANASPGRGRAVYEKTCAACHLLYGSGGKIGPDLTGSNRANLDYILLNSVDPSYDVPEGYRMINILTVDDRVINGVLAREDDARIVLKTVEQPELIIAKEDIVTRRVSPKSMMPEGQFEALKKQEIIDLVKYLQTREQVEVVK